MFLNRCTGKLTKQTFISTVIVDGRQDYSLIIEQLLLVSVKHKMEVETCYQSFNQLLIHPYTDIRFSTLHLSFFVASFTSFLVLNPWWVLRTRVRAISRMFTPQG